MSRVWWIGKTDIRRIRQALPWVAWLLFALCGVAPAQEPPGWTQLAPGVEYQQLAAPAEGFQSRFSLEVFRIDLRLIRPVVADARRPAEGRQVATVETLVRERQALLGINGSFFDERLRPLGLLVENGRIISPLRRADWGVLFVQDGRAQLLHTRDFRAAQLRPEQLDFAIQVGPRLVVNGQPLRLKHQWAHRAAIGIIRQDQLVVVVSRGERVESNDLARLMASPPAAGGLGCRDALMMDGGPSAQLYALAGRVELARPGLYGIPIAVAFIPR